MAWSWQEIENDWLGGSRLAATSGSVVAAFDRVEREFGREWIDSARQNSSVRGSGPTLRIVAMGERLASLDEVKNTERLLRHLRRSDTSAEAELTAVHLLVTGRGGSRIQMYPAVNVDGHEREPDLRVSFDGEPWTYVEVTQPDVSKLQQRLSDVAGELKVLLRGLRTSFALEVFLDRIPTDAELEQLKRRVPEFCGLDGIHSEQLPSQLGELILNRDPPGQFVFRSREGEKAGIIAIVTSRGPGEPHRHIAVRIAFSDKRAGAFLGRKTQQLGKQAPGLIMVQTSNAAGGFSWEPLLRRRFQPKIHTRVSAVCLFQSGLLQTPAGMALISDTRLILNPHARYPLPPSIAESLRRHSGS